MLAHLPKKGKEKEREIENGRDKKGERRENTGD